MASGIVVGIGLFLLGVVATGLISRYYYYKNRNCSVTPYVYSSSRLIAIGSEIEDDLQVIYKGRTVEDIYSLELLFVNDGQVSIRDCVKPLSVSMPDGVEIIDHSVIHRHPDGLEVRDRHHKLKASDEINYDFDLLNPQDFFIAKLLLHGPFDQEKLACKITAEGLPRELAFQSFAKVRTHESDWRNQIYAAAIIASVAFAFWTFSASLFHVLVMAWKTDPSIFPIPWRFFAGFQLETLTVSVVALLALATLILGALLLVAAVLIPFSATGRTYIPIPDELRSRRHRSVLRK